MVYTTAACECFRKALLTFRLEIKCSRQQTGREPTSAIFNKNLSVISQMKAIIHTFNIILTPLDKGSSIRLYLFRSITV